MDKRSIKLMFITKTNDFGSVIWKIEQQDETRCMFMWFHRLRSYYQKFYTSHAKFGPNHAFQINPLLPSKIIMYGFGDNK